MTKYEWESELKKNIHRLPADEIQKVLEYYDELFADKIERGLGECEIISQFGNPVDVADKILSDYDGELSEDTTVPPPNMSRGAEKQPEKPVEKTEEIVHCPDAKERVHNGQKSEPRQAFDETKPVQPQKSEFSNVDTPAPKPVPTNKNEHFHADRAVLFVVLNVLTGFAMFIFIASVWITAVALLVAGGAMAIGGIGGTLISAVQTLMGSGAAGVAQIGGCIALCGVGIILFAVFLFVIKLLAKGTAFIFKQLNNWIYPHNNEVIL